MMEDGEEEENDDNYPMSLEYGGNARGEAEDEEAPDEPMLYDYLRRPSMMHREKQKVQMRS